MRGTLDEIALVEVVGFDPAKEQLVNESPLDLYAVVNSLEENGLISERDSSVSQTLQAFPDLGSQFTGVVAVDRYEEGVILLQDVTEFRGDPLGEEDRNTTSDSHKLYMLDATQAGKDPFKPRIGEKQGIPSG